MTEDILPAGRAAFPAFAVRAAAAHVVRYAALLVLLGVIVFPVYWLVLTSLKQQRDFFTSPPIFFTSNLTLEHYRAVLGDPLNRRYFVNTSIVAVATTVFATLAGTLAAYTLARIRLPFRLNRVLLIWILINRLFPPITLVIPYYLLLRRLGLIDTLPALIVTYTAAAIPFVVWIMLTFFQDLPKEIERAAMVDGCTMWQRFRMVVLPMSLTSMTVTGIFVFIFAWNELLYALALTTLRARTVPVAIAGFVGDNALAWGQMSALSVLSFIPVLLTTLAVQRYLVRGITFGAVKG
jgi:multiple sugar transport system permease protein